MRTLIVVLAFGAAVLTPCLTSAACLDSDTVGSGWMPQTSGTTKDLNSVQFPVDTLTGYVVGGSSSGGGNVILKTTNGGTNWAPQVPPDTTLMLWKVDFPVDADTGWVVGGSGLSCILLKTTDGGATWFYQDISSGVLLGVDFPLDDQTGYVVGVGGMISKTTDGGSHWNGQSSGTSRWLFSVDFPADAMTGYAVGCDTTGGPTGDTTGIILKTTDGGANWATQLSGITKRYSVDFPVDALTGYTMGQGDTILKTTNGGTNWVSQQTPLPNDAPPNGVDFPMDALTGYAVGGAKGSRVQFNRIAKTTNGGAFWGDLLMRYPGVLALHSVHFPHNVMTGYAVGDSGTILKTTDGGEPWGGVEERPEGRSLKAEGGIKTNPNPFTTFAIIPGHEGERFALYDIAGRRVGINKGSRVGDDLRPGVYFIRALEGKVPLVRIVKVK